MTGVDRTSEQRRLGLVQRREPGRRAARGVSAPQLPIRPGQVRLDGADAHEHRLGDLTVGSSFNRQDHRLPLALGEAHGGGPAAIRASEARALAAQSGARSASNIVRADRRDAAATRFCFARRWTSPGQGGACKLERLAHAAWRATASSMCANAAGISPRAAAIDPRLRAAVASVRGRSSFSLQTWNGSSTSSARSTSPMPMSASTASVRGGDPGSTMLRVASRSGRGSSQDGSSWVTEHSRGIRARIDWYHVKSLGVVPPGRAPRWHRLAPPPPCRDALRPAIVPTVPAPWPGRTGFCQRLEQLLGVARPRANAPARVSNSDR